MQESEADRIAFWNAPERVERFAEREPDHRLRALLPQYDDPAGIRVLDLGCAGGRNTVLLAERGFDVWALDAAAAMVARTRQRLAPLTGPAEARRRVTEGRMDDLEAFADGRFELVVALGIYHCAADDASWRRALAETARVLTAGGRLLVSHFAPGTRVSGEHQLRDAGQLDEALKALGCAPAAATETVTREGDGGRRVTVNGTYRKQPSPVSA